MRRPKVLVVSHASGWHGAEKGLFFLAKTLSTFATVEVLLPRAGELKVKLEEEGIRVRVFPYLWWVLMRGNFARDVKVPFKSNPVFFAFASFVTNAGAVAVLSKVAREFDLVWTNSSVVPVGALASRLCGKKHVWHIREIPYANPEFLYVFPVHKVIPKLSDRVVVVAPYLSRWYPNSTFIPNPIPFRFDLKNLLKKRSERRKERRRKSEFTAVMVGYMSPVKRLELALRALKVFGRAKLKVVGGWDEKYKGKILNLARELGVEVELEGRVAEPWKIVEEADFFLMTSHTEVCPFSLLEALGVGSDCVVTDTVAIGGWLEPAVFVARSDPHDIACKIEKLVLHGTDDDAFASKVSELSLENFARKVRDVAFDVLF